MAVDIIEDEDVVGDRDINVPVDKDLAALAIPLANNPLVSHYTPITQFKRTLEYLTMYKKAVIIGATSGIGHGLAEALVKKGTHVIVVGRRQSALEAFTKQYPDQSTALAFDITELSAIPPFVGSITKSHPDIDAIVLNSGIQRPFDFTQPDTVDLSVVDTELTTNYTSYVHLTTAFLSYALAKTTPTSFVYISATLALVPGLLRTPNYNASKAALHTFILNLREQLKRAKTPNHVKIVEVFPPAVQTELHDERHQPDLVNGGEIGMPLAMFTEKCLEGLKKGDPEFAVGQDGVDILNGFEKEREQKMGAMIKNLDTALAKFMKK